MYIICEGCGQDGKVWLNSKKWEISNTDMYSRGQWLWLQLYAVEQTGLPVTLTMLIRIDMWM